MDLQDFANIYLTSRHKKDYREAKPYPHIVLDDFLRTEVIDEIEIPKPDSRWYMYDSAFEKKYATDRFEVMPNTVCKLLMLMNSQPFVNWLEELTGIQGLIGDHTLRGGGIHSIPSGGFLRPHKDFNIHPKLGIYRRVNVILYLNRNWHREWGGGLELWSSDMKLLEKVIEPVVNRMVIFDTAGDHYHGHSEPLACPETRRRISIALYFYTAKPAPGQEDISAHSTKFQLRPGDPKTPEILELIEKRNAGRLASNI